MSSKKRETKISIDNAGVTKLLDRVSEYVILLDGSMNIAFANQAFRGAILKNGIRSFRDTLEEPCLAVLDGGLTTGPNRKPIGEDLHLTVTHRLGKGGTQKVHYRLVPLGEKEGMLGAVGHVLRFDVEEECAPGRPERRAMKPALSQKPPDNKRKSFCEILPRSKFFEETEKEVRAASRYRYPVSCLVIDIDNFSLVNESDGNATGDHVIKRLAQILQTQVRQSDLVAKYGGDDFVILAPHTDRVNARFLAERLRRRVQDTEFEHEEKNIFVTVSIGVATLMQTTGIAGEELVSRAVTALREAQKRGMNRVVIYS